MPKGEGKATLCCGMFPSLLPYGDLITEHAEIATCDNRLPRCPDCKGEASCIKMKIEPSANFDMDTPTIILRVEPCVHEFWVQIGVDSKIRLEKRNA